MLSCRGFIELCHKVRMGQLNDPCVASLLDLEDPPFLGEGFPQK